MDESKPVTNASRARRWVAAIFFQAPMGPGEALALIAPSAVALYAVLPDQFSPKVTDPTLQWVLWWIIVGASAALLGRGIVGLAAWGMGAVRERVPAVPVTFRSPIVRRYPAAVSRPAGELGVLDFEAAAERAMTALSRTLTVMAKDMGDGAKLIRGYTPRFQEAANSSTADKIRLSRELAKKVERYVSKMERRQTEFRSASQDVAQNFLPRLRSFPPEKDLSPLRPQIVGLRDSTASSKASLLGYAKSVGTVRQHNLQQDLNDAWDHLLEVLNRLLEDHDTMLGFTKAALAEIDRRKSRKKPQAAAATAVSSSPAISSQDQT